MSISSNFSLNGSSSGNSGNKYGKKSSVGRKSNVPTEIITEYTNPALAGNCKLISGACSTICKLLTIPQTWLSEPAIKRFIAALPATAEVDVIYRDPPEAPIASVRVPGTN